MGAFSGWLRRMRRRLFGSSGGNHQGVVSGAPGIIGFAFDEITANELGGSLRIDVQRFNGDDGAASVNYVMQNVTAFTGIDYTASSGTLNWANQDSAPKSILVPIIFIAGVSGDFEFKVLLTTPVGAGLAEIIELTVVIERRGAGTVTFVGQNWSVKNPDTNPDTILTVKVSREGFFAGAVTAAFHTVNGTALSGVDYVSISGTLSWLDGEGDEKTIDITIKARTGTPYPDRSFTVVLDTLTGGLGAGTYTTATVTVTDGTAGTNPTTGASPANQIVDLMFYMQQEILVDSEAAYRSTNILVNMGYGSESALVNGVIGFGSDSGMGGPGFTPSTRARFQAHEIL